METESKSTGIRPNGKVKQLHQTAVDAVRKVEGIVSDRENPPEENPTYGDRFSDMMFKIGSSWTTILLLALFVISWVIFNISVPAKYSFDPFPFMLLTFLLAGTAAIQAPVIMISQQRQNQKTSRRIAENLKVENEILSLHQSITILIEQQLQQVHENQLTTIKLLQEIHKKTD